MPDLARFVVTHNLQSLDRPDAVSGVVLVEIEAPAVDAASNTTILETAEVPFWNRQITLALPAKDNPAFASDLARIYLTIRPHGSPAFSRVGITPQLAREAPYELVSLLPAGAWPEVSEQIGGTTPDLQTAAIFPDTNYGATYGGGV